MITPLPASLSKEKRQLLSLYRQLSHAGQQQLCAFAEFLVEREGAQSALPKVPAEVPTPQLLPRPEQESVVGAIKRLTASYAMLDRSQILTETSSLMTAHLVHGREIEEVINELEQLFAKAYCQQFPPSDPTHNETGGSV